MLVIYVTAMGGFHYKKTAGGVFFLLLRAGFAFPVTYHFIYGGNIGVLFRGENFYLLVFVLLYLRSLIVFSSYMVMTGGALRRF